MRLLRVLEDTLSKLNTLQLSIDWRHRQGVIVRLDFRQVIMSTGLQLQLYTHLVVEAEAPPRQQVETEEELRR